MWTRLQSRVVRISVFVRSTLLSCGWVDEHMYEVRDPDWSIRGTWKANCLPLSVVSQPRTWSVYNSLRRITKKMKSCLYSIHCSLRQNYCLVSTIIYLLTPVTAPAKYKRRVFQGQKNLEPGHPYSAAKGSSSHYGWSKAIEFQRSYFLAAAQARSLTLPARSFDLVC
jgi:hypothetical protein